MQKPVFTETMQIGIVVRDLDAAIRRYVDDYAIGPWEVHKFNPGDLNDAGALFEDVDGNVLRPGSDQEEDQPLDAWRDMYGNLWEPRSDGRGRRCEKSLRPPAAAIAAPSSSRSTAAGVRRTAGCSCG
jgi:hypothetical protein